MARLWSSGAELQSATVGHEWVTSVSGTPAIETAEAISGAAALRINNSAAAENVQHIVYTALGDHYWRWYIKLKAAPTNDHLVFLTWMNSANLKVSFRIRTSRALNLFNSEDSAQIGADSPAIALNGIYRLEVRIASTTLAATVVEARLYDTDDATLIWNPSGTIDITAIPNRLRIGTGGSEATFDMIYDNGAVNDASGSIQNSWCGQGELIQLNPNAAGDNTQWTPLAGNNWDNTEETPPDDATTYNQSNTLNQIDDFNLVATPAAMASDDVISAVMIAPRFAISNTTGADPDFVVRIKASGGGTVEESANISGGGSTAWASYRTASPAIYPLVLYDLPGASTTAWTKADLDTAQVGVRETLTDTHFILVTALWVLVDHKPAPPAGGEVFFEDRHPIEQGMKPQTAAGMGGVLVEA